MKKSLLDIQSDVRALERASQELARGITEVSNSIEELRNAGDAGGLDYAAIAKAAKKLPFSDHPIRQLPEYAQRLYFKVLVGLVQLDFGGEATMDRLAFVQWLLDRSTLDVTLEDLLRDAAQLSPETFEKTEKELPKDAQDSLLVDLLIAANIGGAANEELMSYIAGYCGVIGLIVKDLLQSIVVAKIVLRQGLDALNTGNTVLPRFVADKYEYYLKALIEGSRVLVVRVKNSNYLQLEWKAKNKAAVNAGDEIAVLLRGPKGYGNLCRTPETIKAPCAGVLYRYYWHGTFIGVISSAHDYEDAILEWAKQKCC